VAKEEPVEGGDEDFASEILGTAEIMMNKNPNEIAARAKPSDNFRVEIVMADPSVQ
jgi:hypothetical protein